MDVCPLGGVQPPRHTFLLHSAARRRRHPPCMLYHRLTQYSEPSAATPAHSQLLQPLTPDFSAVYRCHTPCTRHACIHRNTHVWTPVHSVGYSPHFTRVLQHLCRFAGSCNATRCTIDARTRITPSCWRQRPHRPTRPTHPPTYASTCSSSWHPYPPFASPLSSILAMAWLFCLSGASPPSPPRLT